MKLKFTLLTLIFSSASFSQINFEKGYIIDKNNNKSECLIKNKDWLGNPTEFEYKLNQNSEIIIGNLNSIKDFLIYIFRISFIELYIFRLIIEFINLNLYI